jgi:hypothetical protein
VELPPREVFAGLPAEMPQWIAAGETAAPGRTSAIAPEVAALRALARAVGALLAETPLELDVVRTAAWASPGGGPRIALRGGVSDAAPESSPWLLVDATARGMEVGLAAAGGDPEATARVRRALLGRTDPTLRETCVRLSAAGWRTSGEPLADLSDGSLPESLRPWLVRRGLRVWRDLPWADWLGEPGLAGEIADRWREILPLFEVMRTPEETTASRRAGDR